MIFHPEAEDEFHNIANYYEAHQPGLGLRFIDAIESGLRQIERSPNTWRRIKGEIRRFLVRTFPHGIVYAKIDIEIYILAIMHLKREPDYWLGRLQDLPSPEGEL